MRGRRCPAEGVEAAAFVPSDAVCGFWKKGGGQKTCLSHSGVASGEGEKVWSPKLPFAPPDPLCLLSVEANEWWINLGSPLANWDDPLQNLPEVCIPLGATETHDSHRAELMCLNCRGLVFFQIFPVLCFNGSESNTSTSRRKAPPFHKQSFFTILISPNGNTTLFPGCTRQRVISTAVREPSHLHIWIPNHKAFMFVLAMCQQGPSDKCFFSSFPPVSVFCVDLRWLRSSCAVPHFVGSLQKQLDFWSLGC